MRTITKIQPALRAIRYWFELLSGRGRFCPKQQEINRLRRLLYDIANSRPDQYMDIEKNPELVNWICETCFKARVGVYPPDKRDET